MKVQVIRKTYGSKSGNVYKYGDIIELDAEEAQSALAANGVKELTVQVELPTLPPPETKKPVKRQE